MLDFIKDFENIESVQRLFSATQDFISLLDRNYQYILVNDAYLRLYNKPREAIIGKKVAEMVGWEIFDLKIKKSLDHCLDDNIVNFQDWFDFPGVGRRFTDITFFPYHDDREKVVGAVVNGRDITKLANSMQALQETQQRLQIMSEAGKIGLWDWDLSTDEVYFSPEWKKQLGYEDHEIKNDYLDWETRLHPEDFERMKAYVQSYLHSPSSSFRNEFRMKHKDGSYRWILATAALNYDATGKPVRLMGAHVDITERKHKEEALRQSEDILQKAQNVAHIGSWWYDPEIMVPEWTDEMFRIFGLEPAKQPPSFADHKKFFHPEDWAKLDTAVVCAVEEGVGYNMELRLLRPNGEVRHVHSICETDSVKTKYGYRLIGTLQDITTRKRNREEAQNLQKKYQDLFESFRDAIVVADVERTIIDCNRALLEIFGYAKGELMGHKTLYLYNSEQQFKEMGKTIAKQFGEKDFIYTIDYRKKSGEVFPGETSLFYLKDATGTVYGYIGLIRDISEKLEHENNLRKSEARFRLMVENLFDAVIVCNPEGVIQFVNQAARKLFGRSQQQLLGSTLGFPTSFETTHEIEIIQESGELRYAEVKVSPGDWENQDVYLVSARDTTDRVVARKEREMHQENLQQLQRIEAIGTLAGGIAHEFNNILTPILGFTELALERVKDDEVAAECLDEVYQSAARARDLVGQILAFSRQRKETYRPIIIEPIVKEVLKLLRATIPTTIAIHQDINSQGLVIGDSTEIHQILMNLCTNAKHAMETGGGELRVLLHDLTLSKENVSIHPDLQAGHYVHLQVSDNGCGMEPKVMEKIFEPYFTTKEKDKGTGLGLSVVHGIVHNHGGVIMVKSEPGLGTTFDIYLPRTVTQKKTRFEVDPGIERGSEHVLVVDDEPQVLKLHARLLESLGYHVTTRVNSLEAFQLFERKKETFDLLLTDMTMPNMTGDVLAQKCISIKPDFPVILATGFSERMTEEKAKAMGIQAMLFKPVTKTEMAGAIRAALQKSAKSTRENDNGK
jgi:PAS domain S-box-containing protein